jgi:hypothetical protein
MTSSTWPDISIDIPQKEIEVFKGIFDHNWRFAKPFTEELRDELIEKPITFDTLNFG